MKSFKQLPGNDKYSQAIRELQDAIKSIQLVFNDQQFIIERTSSGTRLSIPRRVFKSEAAIQYMGEYNVLSTYKENDIVVVGSSNGADETHAASDPTEELEDGRMCGTWIARSDVPAGKYPYLDENKTYWHMLSRSMFPIFTIATRELNEGQRYGTLQVKATDLVYESLPMDLRPKVINICIKENGVNVEKKMMIIASDPF